MKQGLFVVMLILALAASACGIVRNTDDATCDATWRRLAADNASLEPAQIVSMLLNTVLPPDSVGAYLQDCVDEGWTGWR